MDSYMHCVIYCSYEFLVNSCCLSLYLPWDCYTDIGGAIVPLPKSQLTNLPLDKMAAIMAEDISNAFS